MTKIASTFKIIPILLMAMVLSGTAHADSCLDCHSGWEEGEWTPSKLFSRDIHNQAGLGCADCHGGDSKLEDMDEVRKSEGYRGVPNSLQIPNFCSSCHSDPAYMVKHNPSLPTDQLEKYKTSVHGKRLYENKDSKVANCVSCHSVHDIAPSNMPNSTVNARNVPKTCGTCHARADYMKGYGIPTDQLDKYIASVHGEALLVRNDNAAPACNDCHGNHGATPPGVTSLGAVCGLCHAVVAENFARSPHKPAFDAMGYPECEACHSNHLIRKPHASWVGTGDSALCIQCHSENDGNRGYAAAQSMSESLTRLDASYERARAAVEEADLKGMMVTDERFALGEVKQMIIQSANEIHLFDPEVIVKTSQAGVTAADKVFQAGAKKVEDYYFRRKGLGIATLLITILAIALFFKIRALEKK